ncbi:NACHT domain-containing protein, partial [Streptomyces sp. NPDC002920]
MLVLRGEWGMGKSFALDQEHRDLEATGRVARRLDLGKCGSDASRAAAKLEAVFQRPSTAIEWHVLLDGLDEGLDALPDLDQLVVEQLEGLGDEGRRGLRLRISCRTARWPAGLETDLGRFWPTDMVAMVALAPLSRDVALAAEVVGLEDPVAFCKVVQQRGLVALATHPMTLRHMLTSYTNRGSLPETTAEAYREACLQLCKEIRRPKRAEVRRTQATAENLYAVAARVAAALQLGPYTALADGAPPSTGTPVDDLELSRLAPGNEPGPLGTPVPCTMNELSQLTESSLLHPLGDYRWTFVHKSYQEFLAAEFLRSREIQPAVERELLWIGDGPSRHVLPAHQEVAAWRSNADAEMFEDLLRDDPQVLLLADLPRRSDRDRGRVVEALLALLQNDDTIRLDSESLHRLDHPEIADQLRPYLNASAEVTPLFAAVGMARACRRPELNPDLLALAEDRDAYTDVRVSALAGITEPESGFVARIRGLLNDDSPEIVAAALRQLWPDHLTMTEFLRHTRDPDPDLIGRAYMLRMEIPELIQATHVEEAVTWARDALCGTTEGESRTLAVAVLARAVSLAGQASGSAALLHDLADALLGLADHHGHLLGRHMHTPLKDLAAALGDHIEVRRALASMLLTRATDEQLFALHMGRLTRALLLREDAVYWMEHWDLLSGTDERFARLAVAFPPPEDQAALDRARAARASHPTLYAATAFWDNPPEESSWEREQRELEEAERRRNTYDEAALRSAFDAVLATGANEVRSAWGRVIGELHRTTDGSSPKWERPWLMASRYRSSVAGRASDSARDGLRPRA